MPHWPYYYDSHGKEVKLEAADDSHKLDKKAYIEYLMYVNKKLLELIDYIKRVSAKPPIIVLMGDHGFRQFTDRVDKKCYFANLNTIYFQMVIMRLL